MHVCTQIFAYTCFCKYTLTEAVFPSLIKQTLSLLWASANAASFPETFISPLSALAISIHLSGLTSSKVFGGHSAIEDPVFFLLTASFVLNRDQCWATITEDLNVYKFLLQFDISVTSKQVISEVILLNRHQIGSTIAQLTWHFTCILIRSLVMTIRPVF